MSRNQRYIAVLISMTLSCLIVMAALNYTIDARGIYGVTTDTFRDYIRTYSSRLLASQHGLKFVPFERAIKAELARSANGDCFVTGSSQTMGIDADSFPLSQRFHCTTIINLAVSGGSYEDFLISAGILAKRRVQGTLFVGIPPWMLRSHAEIGWTVEAEQLALSRQILGLAAVERDQNEILWKASNLLSGSYLRRNIAALIDRKGFDPPSIEYAPANATKAIYRPSGSTRSPPPPRTQRIGNGDFSYKIARPFVDPRVTSELQQVFRVLKGNGLQVVVLVMPYHESAFECRTPLVCQAFQAVENELRHIADANNLPVIGGYDPRPFGLVDDDFIDALHMNPDSLKKLQ